MRCPGGRQAPKATTPAGRCICATFRGRPRGAPRSRHGHRAFYGRGSSAKRNRQRPGSPTAGCRRSVPRKSPAKPGPRHGPSSGESAVPIPWRGTGFPHGPVAGSSGPASPGAGDEFGCTITVPARERRQQGHAGLEEGFLDNARCRPAGRRRHPVGRPRIPAGRRLRPDAGAGHRLLSVARGRGSARLRGPVPPPHSVPSAACPPFGGAVAAPGPGVARDPPAGPIPPRDCRPGPWRRSACRHGIPGAGGVGHGGARGPGCLTAPSAAASRAGPAATACGSRGAERYTGCGAVPRGIRAGSGRIACGTPG